MSSMEWSSVSWLWVLLVLLHSLFHVSRGCFEEERNALLDYKAFANVTDDTSPYIFPPNLTSWDDKSNCCAWPRVRCNHTTGRVIEISLNYTIPYDRDAVMYLNATIFLPFVDLQSLDLSSNYLDGWLKNEGFERLHGLTKLQVLDLSWNKFNSSIVSSLLGFSSLKSLSLAGNFLEEFQGFERLHGLTKLQVLDLSSNNRLNSSILSSLLGFSSLKSLSLAGNNMEGPIPIQGMPLLTSIYRPRPI
ncbi:hypothetical protein HHK36_025841 [Tetracentron sinense]|uniref:Leucine-rich repeat-containing N-terminal plant-type domain-containing protein n=1 Tax=Tetracentron sinense TaxID=13715 RepID=A0A835D3E4_TETSI|nr:hypothetical protein HHK36_025841 [Tetracentron sinense]